MDGKGRQGTHNFFTSTGGQGTGGQLPPPPLIVKHNRVLLQCSLDMKALRYLVFSVFLDHLVCI